MTETFTDEDDDWEDVDDDWDGDDDEESENNYNYFGDDWKAVFNYISGEEVK